MGLGRPHNDKGEGLGMGHNDRRKAWEWGIMIGGGPGKEAR
jgi:hypothetical protein